MLAARAKLVALLSSHGGILRQIQWYLFMLRIYLPTKRQYERRYYHWSSSAGQRMKDNTTNESFKFPDYPGRLLRIWNVLANTALVWVFLKWPLAQLINGWHRLLYKQTFGRLDNEVERANLEASFHCYSFGRIVVHYELSDEAMAAMLALFQLLWRGAQFTLDRWYSFDVLLFLMQPKEEIEQFIRKLEETNELIECIKRGRQQRKLSSLYERIPVAPLGLNYGRLSQRERLLCDILCYKVTFTEMNEDILFRETTPRVLYKLRPNRTLEARKRLIDLLVNTSILAAITMLTLATILMVYITVVILFNQFRYFKDYPGCDLELSRFFTQNSSSGHHWSLPRLTGHRLAVINADAFENAVVWGESGLALVYALMFVYYLNQDLLLYWAHLEEKICVYSLEMRKVHSLSLSRMINKNDGDEDDDDYDYDDDDGDDQTISGSLLLGLFHEQTYELQAQLGDFFRQIKQVDLLVSDVITHALCVWLTSFGYFSFKSASLWSSTHNAEFAIICITVSGLVFICYTMFNMSLLSLQRRCHLAYPNLCTLMALDDSWYKKQFGQLTRYYTEKNRTCYTWFQQVPFSTTNFLSVVGWSFTGFLVLDNLYNRH